MRRHASGAEDRICRGVGVVRRHEVVPVFLGQVVKVDSSTEQEARDGQGKTTIQGGVQGPGGAGGGSCSMHIRRCSPRARGSWPRSTRRRFATCTRRSESSPSSGIFSARVEALSWARPTAKARRRVENDPARRHSPSRTGATTPALVAGLPRAGSLLLPVGSQSRREE